MIASIMPYSLLENETFEIGVLVHPEHTMWHKAGTQLVFIELNETDTYEQPCKEKNERAWWLTDVE